MDSNKWIDAEKQKPEHNKGVLVFIPEEDYHVTSGMWDIDNKWVLLDEYRVPESKVTHWAKLPELPEPYKAERKRLYANVTELFKRIKLPHHHNQPKLNE